MKIQPSVTFFVPTVLVLAVATTLCINASPVDGNQDLSNKIAPPSPSFNYAASEFTAEPVKLHSTEEGIMRTKAADLHAQQQETQQTLDGQDKDGLDQAEDDEDDEDEDEDDEDEDDEDEDGEDEDGEDEDGEDEDDESGDGDDYEDYESAAYDDDMEFSDDNLDDIHTIDPLTTAGEQFPVALLHKRNELPEDNSNDNSTSASADKGSDNSFEVLATPEPGGACIDSFVNYALRFRERCTIPCLRTMTHVFSNPNVLGLLSCFGCSNFIVQGLYALGVDCAGLFSNPQPPAGNKKRGDDDTSPSLKLGDLDKNVNPADAGLSPLNFGSMMNSLHNVDMGELQDWFDIGADIYKAVKTTGHANELNSQNATGVTEAQKLEAEEERVEVDKDLFNKFVTKAASFANWTLTPDMVEGSGVFDRLHDMKVL